MQRVVLLWSRILEFLGISTGLYSIVKPVLQKQVVWIVACNQAGKTTLLKALDGCRGSVLYREDSAAAYRDYRIFPCADIRRLIDNTLSHTVMFELANDLQYTDRYLDLYPRSKALWIFRPYRNVVRDIVKKWGDAQKEMLIGIVTATERHPGQYAIAEEMSAGTEALVKRFSHESMSAEDGAALVWYLRNNMYFQLHLDKDPRVLLVRHDELVASPRRLVRRVFDFIQRRYDDQYADCITPAQAADVPLAGLDPEIAALCDDMLQRLNEKYTQSLQ